MSDARIAASAIPRRGFFALGGAGIAATALAGCSSNVEDPSESRDVELLSAALAGEENTVTALQAAAGEVEGSERELVEALNASATKRVAQVQDLIAEREAPAGSDFAVEGSGPDAALEAAVEATNQAIAAYRLGAGQFSTEDLRVEALDLIGGAAVRVSLLGGLLGEDQSPEPFVTGGSEPPISHAEVEDDGDAETTSTTSTTSTEATTTSSEDGQ